MANKPYQMVITRSEAEGEAGAVISLYALGVLPAITAYDHLIKCKRAFEDVPGLVILSNSFQFTVVFTDGSRLNYRLRYEV